MFMLVARAPPTTTMPSETCATSRCPTGTNIDYVIDGQNRRLGKKVNGVMVEGFFYRSQLQPVAWLDRTGAVKATFIDGLHANVPEYMVQGATTYRLITDQVGSVRLVVNASTGAMIQRIDYDEFGNVLIDSAPGFQPIGFAGGVRDLDTGLTRFGARDYDSVTGRWAEKDPLRFGGGSGNLYRYVNNDAVNATDPTGLTSYLCTKPLDALAAYGGMDPGQTRSFNESEWNPLFHEFICTDSGNASVTPMCGGVTASNNWALGWGAASVDTYSSDRCYPMQSSHQGCFDQCVFDAFHGSRPWIYFVGGYCYGPVQNCQVWATDALSRCYKRCGQ